MTQAIATGPGLAGGGALGDCRVLAVRSIRHLTRNVEQLFQTAILPIVLVLMFRYLLGGAINTGQANYANYVIAGLIVISVAFNSTTVAVGVATDLQVGLVERFRSMPMFGASVLVGHVASAVVRNVLTTIVVVLMGLAVGFEPTGEPLRWLAALGIVLVYTVGLAWIAVLLGIVSGGAEAAGGFAMFLVFLPYASSSLVPPQTMPGVLRAVTANQPFTPVVDAIRALLLDTPVGSTAWLALAWWVGITIVAAALSIRIFARRTA